MARLVVDYPVAGGGSVQDAAITWGRDIVTPDWANATFINGDTAIKNAGSNMGCSQPAMSPWSSPPVLTPTATGLRVQLAAQQATMNASQPGFVLCVAKNTGGYIKVPLITDYALLNDERLIRIHGKMTISGRETRPHTTAIGDTDDFIILMHDTAGAALNEYTRVDGRTPSQPSTANPEGTYYLHTDGTDTFATSGTSYTKLRALTAPELRIEVVASNDEVRTLKAGTDTTFSVPQQTWEIEWAVQQLDAA